MKVIAFLAVVGLIAVAQAVPQVLPEVPAEVSALLECPPPVEGGKTINIHNCRDCTKFFMCVGTMPVQMSCPAGLHFNARVGVCDFPQKACCDYKWDPKQICRSYSGIC